MVDNNNLRSAIINETPFLPQTSSAGLGLPLPPDAVLRTPMGNVRALAPPPIPHSPLQPVNYNAGAYNYNAGGYNYNSGGYNYNAGSYNYNGGLGAYGGYGSGGYGSGGYGGGGYGGGAFGAFNRFGSMNDPEQRFIQLAEASSRPAFQSIEALVSAVGNIASMLDSTFFALTSSFRAILGVAANFGRLRGVFAQFWSTFAIFRGLSWIYRKILFWLRISNLDPSSQAFKKAFAEAVHQSNDQGMAANAPRLPRKGQSPWPVLAFLSFIFTAPYLIMKLLGSVTNTAHEEARNPVKWTSSIHTQAVYDFEARNPSELTLRAGQAVQVAPREIQQTLSLLNTGWALASTNGQSSGIIPLNYVKTPQQMRQEREQLKPQPELMNLSSVAFPAPPQIEQINNDMHLEGQQHGPPSIDEVVFEEGFASS